MKVAEHPDQVPGYEWDTLVDDDIRDEWRKKNCDVFVGGSKKDKCPGMQNEI